MIKVDNNKGRCHNYKIKQKNLLNCLSIQDIAIQHGRHHYMILFSLSEGSLFFRPIHGLISKKYFIVLATGIFKSILHV